MTVQDWARRRTTILLALVVCATIGVTFCGGASVTTIRDILASPGDYDGKTLIVSGTVTDSTNLLVVKYYVISDGTGSLTVLTDKAVPPKGEKARVKGRIDQAFALKGKSLVVLHELAE